MKAKHFAGLDGLRFISITFVVLHHLFTFKSNFGFTTFDYPILRLIGFYGIQFFFMGSGFLISYLLLSEHKTYGHISLKQFFLRRIFRIWPAYYLLIALALVFALKTSFFHIPGTTDIYLSSDYQKSNLFYFSFLPHLQPFFFPTGPYVHHTYTIGIEEQFYILWGLLFYFFKRWVHTFLIVLLIVCPLMNVLHYWINSHQQAVGNLPLLNYISAGITYIHYSRLSTFAIGSLFGYAYFHQKSWIEVFKRWWVQLLVYIALVTSIAFKVAIPFIDYEYMSAVMGCVMLMATFKKESLINYSAKWMSYLGKISYGIYLFHIFAIVFACKIVGYFFKTESNLYITALLCILTMALSVLFGGFSYHYFETYFLKLKQRFRQSSRTVSFSKDTIKDAVAHEK
jgi:peptidoglycan/LPS O-acetylase OafA/YrhL